MFNIQHTSKPITSNEDVVDVYANIVTPDISGSINGKVFEESEKIKYSYVSSVTHLRLEECKGYCNRLLKNFNAEDVTNLFKNLATTDQQLYVDIINLISAIISEADTAKFRVYYSTLATLLGLDITEVEEEKDTDSEEPKEVPPPKFDKEPNLKNLPKKKEKEETTKEDTDEKKN